MRALSTYIIPLRKKMRHCSEAEYCEAFLQMLFLTLFTNGNILSQRAVFKENFVFGKVRWIHG